MRPVVARQRRIAPDMGTGGMCDSSHDSLDGSPDAVFLWPALPKCILMVFYSKRPKMLDGWSQRMREEANWGIAAAVVVVFVRSMSSITCR